MGKQSTKTSPEISQAVGVVMELSEDEQFRLQAEAREKFRRDEAARLKLARQEECLKVAKAALQKNFSPEDVASITSLSMDEVKALAASLPANH